MGAGHAGPMTQGILESRKVAHSLVSQYCTALTMRGGPGGSPAGMLVVELSTQKACHHLATSESLEVHTGSQALPQVPMRSMWESVSEDPHSTDHEGSAIVQVTMGF